MTDKKVMQMALDALETHAKQYPHMSKGYTVDAVEALRAALAQPEPEPVAWIYSPTGTLFDICPQDADEGEFLPLYTAPPKKEWVGLTDAEAMEIEDKSPDIRWAIIQAEAKLKEKNT